MRALCYGLMMLWALVAGVARADTPPPSSHHLAMRLVAESDHPRSGSTVTLAFDTRPEAGWHGYWQNPGDAGLPTELRWTLPAGAIAGSLRYPVPQRLLIAGLMNYVFEKPYAPLVDLAVPAGLAAGTKLPIRVHASYLVCTTAICVPETSDLSIDLVVGDGAANDQARFYAWRRATPRPLGGTATWTADKNGARIAIPYPAAAPLADAYFYPVTTGAIDYAAPQTVTRDGDRVLVATKASGGRGTLDGVLAIGGGPEGERGLAVHATPGAVAASDGGGSLWVTASIALAGAVLGGLILNVMPCVFPILSLKALQLARANTAPADARREALAYTAGVVLVCLGLGAIILALRAGGTSVGWAFQLQNPRVIVALLLLTAAIGFNLAGLFELPTPQVSGHGASGAFATGALAAIVATPCTGPFMGAALGAALVLPAVAALAVFAGLGLGLSLPFLLIGFVPALRRRLPKPGVWMETMRHILSVPMFLTAIALGWVLGRQTGVNGLTLALVAVLAVALVLWGAGGRQRRGLGFGWGSVVALVLVAAAGMMLVSHAPASAATPATAGAEPFSEQRLAALRAQHRPVFAYFTADWCLTCKVNEKGAIETAGVHDAFAKNNVAVLVGDWTNGDPALGRFIEAHNRAGVPLYLYYAPGADEPRVLPQVLTPGTLTALAG